MPTFEEAYCLQHHCDKWQFRRAAFWHSLYPHALPLAILLGGERGRFFDADRELISGVAQVTGSHQLSEEIRDFFENPANRRWARRHLRIRISTTRLRRFARAYIAPPMAGAAAPA